MVSFGMAPNSYRISALGRGIGPHLHRMVSLGMPANSDGSFLLGAGPGTDGYAVLPHSRSPVSVSGRLFSRRIGLGAHSCGIVPRSNSADPSGQGIVAAGPVIQIVIVPGGIRSFRGLHTVVMGHGFFQLGQVHGVAVFTAGGHMGDLTAGTAIANGKGTCARLPGCAGLDGCGARFGIPARYTAGAVCLGTCPQGDSSIHYSFCIFTDGHGIFLGYGRIADGNGRTVGTGAVAHSHGLAAFGRNVGTCRDGVAGRLIEGNRIEFVQVVRFLIVIHRRPIRILIGQGRIGCHFFFSDFLFGIRIYFCIGMDVLRRSGGIPVSIPEHLGHLGGLAIFIFIPGCIILGCSLVAICISIIDNGFIGNLGLIADSRRPCPFGPALITYGCGSFCLRGNSQIVRLPFPLYQLFIVLIHGLSLGGIFRILAQGIGLRTDSCIVLPYFLFPFPVDLVPHGQIAVIIISRSPPIAQIDWISRPGSRWPGKSQSQSQSQDIYPPGIRFRLACSFPWFRAISDTTTQLFRTLLQMTL